jgi:peroxiredoxin
MLTTLLIAAALMLSATPTTALQVGDKAPDFSLPATTAEKIGLSDFVGKKPVVVFFYIGAFMGP